MEEINALFQGFSVVLTPMNFVLMLVGIILGVLIGVLPGLGGARKVIITTATKAPTNEEVKAAVSACPARPSCAIG